MSTLTRDTYGGFAPTIRPGASTNTAIGATSGLVAAFTTGVSMVRLLASVDAYVAFGPGTPAATTSSMLIKAGVAEYFGIQKGDRIAVIQAASAGTLNVTEGSIYVPGAA
jgi:hypothetical protein